MMIVNKQIEYFRQFLIASWPYVDHLMENHDWDDDGEFIDEWLQVNWEFLVERELLGPNKFLLPFGFGGERVTNTQAIANYMIRCKPKNHSFCIDNKTGVNISKDAQLIFRRFSTKIESTYGLYPPFDYAGLTELDNKKIYFVPVKEIDFYLEEIE